MHILATDNDGQDMPAPVIPNNVADDLRRIRLRCTRNASRDNDGMRRARTNTIASPIERQRKLRLAYLVAEI